MNLKTTLAALDIGSTKVTLLVAEKVQGDIKLIGQSVVKNDGVRQGEVIHIDKTTESIKKAKREAELSSGCELHEVYVSLGGLHIKSFDSAGMAAVQEDEVTTADVEAVLKMAQAVKLPEDRAVLHVLPKEYALDGRQGIQNPVGMMGVRLEAQAHLVTALGSSLPNMNKCVEQAGLKVKDFVLQQYASSYSVLHEEEKELGVVLVEIGGGTCEWVVFHQGMVMGAGAIPIGGQHFTHDLSIGLRTSQASAEQLKKDHANCFLTDEEREQELHIEDVGGQGLRVVRHEDVQEIVLPRAEEILTLLYEDLEEHGFLDKITSGIVLTGGASALRGFGEFAKNYLKLPVRSGRPHIPTSVNEVVDQPGQACVAGLLLYGAFSRGTSKLGVFQQEHATFSTASTSGAKLGVEASAKTFGQQFKEFIGL